MKLETVEIKAPSAASLTLVKSYIGENPLSLEDERRSLVSDACVEWQNDLRAFLIGVLKCRDQAEDAWQRTVVSALNSATNVDPQTLRGWLFRVALNEARQILRTSRRRRDLQQKLVDEKLSPWIQQAVQSGDEDVLVTAELIAVVRKSMERLPDEQQAVVRLRIYEGKSFAQIADQMQRPIGTVLTWMRRALLSMKEDRSLRSLVDVEVDPEFGIQ